MSGYKDPDPMTCPRCKGTGKVDTLTADQVRAIREALKLSMRAMGARLGCSATAVYWWESGAQDVPPARLAQYRALGNEMPGRSRRPVPVDERHQEKGNGN